LVRKKKEEWGPAAVRQRKEKNKKKRGLNYLEGRFIYSERKGDYHLFLSKERGRFLCRKGREYSEELYRWGLLMERRKGNLYSKEEEDRAFLTGGGGSVFSRQVADAFGGGRGSPLSCL